MNNRETLSYQEFEAKVFEIVRSTLTPEVANRIITDESESDAIADMYDLGDTAALAAISIMEEHEEFTGKHRRSLR